MNNPEVFKKPTVEQVIFQIKFPNLFYLESKIGDIQVKIMDIFPESALLYRKELIINDLGQNVNIENLNKENKAEKIWQFNSNKGYSLNILSNSLDITSKFHKTYNNENADSNKFRDVIEKVLKCFIETINIPYIQRVGLRYIDKCPIPNIDLNSFKENYDSSFPFHRFNLENSEFMEFRNVSQKNGLFLSYFESYQKGNNKLTLDFDGFANEIKTEDCLITADKLHEMISLEYFKTIKEPIKKIMRGE